MTVFDKKFNLFVMVENGITDTLGIIDKRNLNID